MPRVIEKVCEKMKRDLKLLFQEAGKKVKEGEHEVGHDLNSLSKKLERHHINLTATSLRKPPVFRPGKTSTKRCMAMLTATRTMP